MHQNRKVRALRSCLLVLALTATMPVTTAAAEGLWMFDVNTATDGSAELSAVDVVGTQIWVGGTEFDSKTGKAEQLLAFWDGSALIRVPSPAADPTFDTRLRDLTIIGDDVLTVATTTSAGGTTQPVIQRYSRIQPGQSSVLPRPPVDTYGELNAITSLPDGRALLAGTTGPAAATTQTLLVEQDPGTTGWRRLASESPGTGRNQLNAVSPDGTWAAGFYTHSDEPGQSHLLVLHDAGAGAGWTQLTIPDQVRGINELTGIVVTRTGDVFVSGWAGADNSDLEHRTAIAMRWNQSAWEVLEPSETIVTQFNDVIVTPDGMVLFAGYAVADAAETAILQRWTGGPRLQNTPIIVPATNDEDAQYPGTGISDIDAGTAGAKPWAVGWRRSTTSQKGATLRQR